MSLESIFRRWQSCLQPDAVTSVAQLRSELPTHLDLRDYPAQGGLEPITATIPKTVAIEITLAPHMLHSPTLAIAPNCTTTTPLYPSGHSIIDRLDLIYARALTPLQDIQLAPAPGAVLFSMSFAHQSTSTIHAPPSLPAGHTALWRYGGRYDPMKGVEDIQPLSFTLLSNPPMTSFTVITGADLRRYPNPKRLLQGLDHPHKDMALVDLIVQGQITLAARTAGGDPLTYVTHAVQKTAPHHLTLTFHLKE